MDFTLKYFRKEGTYIKVDDVIGILKEYYIILEDEKLSSKSISKLLLHDIIEEFQNLKR